ncbi:MAG: tetratricopeptide repeat protein [Paludibacter sp.]
MRLNLFIFSVILSVSLFAAKVDVGEQYFNNKQYSKAKVIYENLLRKKPTDPLYNFRYAVCCNELKDATQAIIHFELSGQKFPLSLLYLGELYFKLYRFDESVASYQTYINTLDSIDSKRPELLKKLKKSTSASRLISKVEDISIIDSAQVNKSDFLKFYKFNSELGSLNQEIINMPHHRKADRIKYLTQRKDRMYFSDSIQGQMNILSAFKLLDGWSKPQSISDQINTPANENYPFLLLDGVTVYFASDGENSLGGYDIFVTRFNPSTNSYLPPENIGFPFNSTANDYMMVIDEQNKTGWFSTDRNQPSGKIMIYRFVQNETRNIVRTENKEYLRNVALLKSYRRISSTKADNNESNIEILTSELQKQMEFVINDSIVYTTADQFKNPDALKLWNEYLKISVDFKSHQKELAELRQKFDQSENVDQRKALTPQIIDLETHNIEIKKLLSVKQKEVRNLELNFLQKK